jgi:hypothetical protein
MGNNFVQKDVLSVTDLEAVAIMGICKVGGELTSGLKWLAWMGDFAEEA